MIKPEDVPDLTLSELQESDEYDEMENDIRPHEEMKEELDDTMEQGVLLHTAIALAWMLEDDVITLREYMEYAEYLEDRERSLENALW